MTADLPAENPVRGDRTAHRATAPREADRGDKADREAKADRAAPADNGRRTATSRVTVPAGVPPADPPIPVLLQPTFPESPQRLHPLRICSASSRQVPMKRWAT